MFLLGPVGQLGIFGISSILFIGHTSSRCSDVDVAIYFLSRDKVRLEVCVSSWAVGHIRHIKHSAQRPHELSNPPSWLFKPLKISVQLFSPLSRKSTQFLHNLWSLHSCSPKYQEKSFVANNKNRQKYVSQHFMTKKSIMDFSQFNGYFVVPKSSHCPVLSLMEKVMLTWLMWLWLTCLLKSWYF